MRPAVRVPKRRTAADCLARLESSRLYQRREMESRQSLMLARVAALWYLGDDYKERYLEAK